MCVIEKKQARINLFNMTLAARLQIHNTCVEVPISSWSGACPNCRHELRVSLASCPAKRPAPQTPQTPQTPVTPTFTFTPTYFTPYTTTLPPLDDSLRRLDETYKALRLSGWYYGNLDWQGARALLKEASVGAFLIRNSGDSNFIFSLSVQTDRGPTSVRLHFEEGFFRLDCDRLLARYMPRFRCVVELIQHYTRAGQGGTGGGGGGAGTVWVDRDGCPHSPVVLTRPLRPGPPSLMHAARLAVHRALDSNPLRPKLRCAPKHRLLPLPSTLIDYLGEYPYSI